MTQITGDSHTNGRVPNGRSGTAVNSLYSLSYVSTQAEDMSNEALLELLNQCRERNGRLGITGLLLHRGDSFFQILEGEQAAVHRLFERIRKDVRHLRVETVTEGAVEVREYTDWQMAFVELDGKDFSEVPGFSDLLKQQAAPRDFLKSLSRSKKLALLFSIME
ncbi:MAG: BLUF domain-containing protein [Pseudomonadota bacterium]